MTDEEIRRLVEGKVQETLHEIRLFRLHVSETAAISAVLNDYGALAVEFPDAIDMTSAFQMMQERYADYGLVGCFINVKLSRQCDEETREQIHAWIRRLDIAKHLERMRG